MDAERGKDNGKDGENKDEDDRKAEKEKDTKVLIVYTHRPRNLT